MVVGTDFVVVAAQETTETQVLLVRLFALVVVEYFVLKNKPIRFSA